MILFLQELDIIMFIFNKNKNKKVIEILEMNGNITPVKLDLELEKFLILFQNISF